VTIAAGPQLVSAETLHGCAGRNKRLYMLPTVDDCYCAVSGDDDSATATYFNEQAGTCYRPLNRRR